MLYYEDFQVGQSRTAGVYELREDDVIAFARQWDPQPWHVELPNPARPGDRLTFTMTCVDKRASASRSDRGLVTCDAVLTNQHGTPVLKIRPAD